MSLYVLLIFAVVMTSAAAINRPVHKVVLTQKGYTQFLQYDLETPPLREFTFCAWLRTYDIESDQNIFSYVVRGNNRVLTLWIDSGGHSMKLFINGKMATINGIDMMKDVWRHVCISYQSDFGAWALYLDTKLITCETSQSLYGFVLPEDGSVIVGYGTGDNGTQSGFEGEIFGANMLLSSTIGRNHTIARHYLYQQKLFVKNRIRTEKKIFNYIVLGDLNLGRISNSFEKSTTQKSKPTHYHTKSTHSFIDHALKFNKSRSQISKEQSDEVFSAEDVTPNYRHKINFWEFVNGEKNIFKTKHTEGLTDEQFGSGTKDLVMISDIEKPPPPGPYNADFSVKKIETNIPVTPHQNTNINENRFINKETYILPEVETPPLPNADKNVYGQWTSSKFAGNVLNYLKSINFHNREIRQPPAPLRLKEALDSFPYSSDFKITKLQPPVQYQRKYFFDAKNRLFKRDTKNLPQINVQILEDNNRSTILKFHAATLPKNVDITNRGEPTSTRDRRNNRNSKPKLFSAEIKESTENIYKPTPFSFSAGKRKKIKTDASFPSNKLLTILPFLKSLEYFVDESVENVPQSSDLYAKSLSQGNKWHNVKTYNNDYTPRRINLETNNGNLDLGVEANEKHPSIRLKFKHENNKLVNAEEDPSITKGRELASLISNFSEPIHDTISIVKYNHGFLPSHKKNLQGMDRPTAKMKNVDRKNNFNKRVKLGNALNERDVIGHNEEQKKKSFIGGNDHVPDINRYRSVIDNEDFHVPASLRPRVCMNMDFNSRILYIQPDGSIIDSPIESPIRQKTIATQFILENYKCSIEYGLHNNPLLYIDWNNTPVRLFGGASPKVTTDLCGFFK